MIGKISTIRSCSCEQVRRVAMIFTPIALAQSRPAYGIGCGNTSKHRKTTRDAEELFALRIGQDELRHLEVGTSGLQTDRRFLPITPCNSCHLRRPLQFQGYKGVLNERNCIPFDVFKEGRASPSLLNKFIKGEFHNLRAIASPGHDVVAQTVDL